MSKQITKGKSQSVKSIQDAKSVKKASKTTPKTKWEFPLEKQNLILLAIGLVVILIGYALMSTGITEEPAIPDGKWNNPMAVTIAPVLLIIGYCVIIPVAILKSFKKKEESNG